MVAEEVLLTLAVSWGNPYLPLLTLGLGVLKGGAEVPGGPTWELGGGGGGLTAMVPGC